MDLLQTIRQYSTPILEPIAAMELWQQTGSRVALKQILKNGMPIHESLLQNQKKH
jgi:hypothetical protein